MRKVMITTGVAVAYKHTPVAKVFLFQKPAKENIPKDLSFDALSRVFLQRRTGEKKKTEGTLAGFLKTVRKEEDKGADKPFVPRSDPVRVVTFPYPVTAASYLDFDENTQLLAVGLLNGAVIVYDVALGCEKFFLERHPDSVTSLAFW